MICATELKKHYGDIRAVDGVSFEIRPGETFGLLGPNGAGKTTTIHMLVGAIRPDSGTVRIGDQMDPTNPKVRKSIGIAPQSLSLYEEMSADENVAFFGKIYGLSGPKLTERVAWSLAYAGLTDRATSRVKTYSGGMKRRLNLACALVHDPKVLLLDEPTVGVDPQSRHHLFDNIEAQKSEGRTILYTTHYMEEAERLCDRVAIVDNGRVLAIDTVERLIAEYGGASVVSGEWAGVPPEGVLVPGMIDGDREAVAGNRDGGTGRTFRFQTDRPLEEVSRLVDAGVQFKSMKIDQPDLETVFLKLTGRSLRD